MEALNEVSEAIKTNDIELFIANLYSLPIGSISQAKADEILVRFLVEAAEYSRSEITRTLLEYYDENSDSNALPTFVYLFTLNAVPFSALQFLVVSFEEQTLLECV